MKLKVEREIERINRYEKQWKIQTSHDIFKLILPQFKTKTKVVNGRELNNSKEGKVLDLKLQSNGITGHVSNIKDKGNAVTAKLRRFSNLTPKLKTTLIKTLLLAILEYPTTPLCIASKHKKRNYKL